MEISDLRGVKTLITKVPFQRVLAGKSKRFIFVFHDISDPGSPQYSEAYSTSQEVFRKQIEFLLKRFDFVPLDQVLMPNVKSPKRRIAGLTFDDGFLTVREHAFPYLKEKGVPFAFFASANAIKNNRLSNGATVDDPTPVYDRKVFLDEDDVRYLYGQGVFIGSHSFNHKVLAACSDEELNHEISDNKTYLEGITGRPVEHIALPFGKREHYNDHVLRFCASAGHRFVYTSNPTYFDPPGENAPRLIPRIGLTNQSPEELLFLINRPVFRSIDI